MKSLSLSPFNNESLYIVYKCFAAITIGIIWESKIEEALHGTYSFNTHHWWLVEYQRLYSFKLSIQRSTRLNIPKERTKAWKWVDFSVSTFSTPWNSCLLFLSFFQGQEETRGTKTMDRTLENYVARIYTSAFYQGRNRKVDELYSVIFHITEYMIYST